MIPLTWQVKAIAAGVLVAIVLGIGAKIYSSGKNAGRGEGTREQLDIDKGSMEQERATFLDRLNKSQAKDAAAQEQFRQQQASIARSTERLAQLAGQRDQSQKAIAALSDADVFGDVTKKLNLRSPKDPAQTFYAGELRAIDSAVSEVSSLRESNAELAKKQQATEASIATLTDRVNLIAGQRDDAIAFGNEMVGHYTAAYNAAQKHHSKLVTVLTLGLVRTKKLGLPDPVTLGAPVKK